MALSYFLGKKFVSPYINLDKHWSHSSVKKEILVHSTEHAQEEKFSTNES